MSSILADIDATCASLGYDDGNHYIADPEALSGLKVLFKNRTKRTFNN